MNATTEQGSTAFFVNLIDEIFEVGGYICQENINEIWAANNIKRTDSAEDALAEALKIRGFMDPFGNWEN